MIALPKCGTCSLDKPRGQIVGAAQYLRIANPSEQLLRALFLSKSPNDEVFGWHVNCHGFALQLTELLTGKPVSSTDINKKHNYSRK